MALAQVASCLQATPRGPQPPLQRSHFGPHRCVGNRVGAKGSVLAGEGATRSSHQAGAASTSTLVGDKAVRPWSVR